MDTQTKHPQLAESINKGFLLFFRVRFEPVGSRESEKKGLRKQKESDNEYIGAAPVVGRKYKEFQLFSCAF